MHTFDSKYFSYSTSSLRFFKDTDCLCFAHLKDEATIAFTKFQNGQQKESTIYHSENILFLELDDESSLEILPKYESPRRRPNWYVNLPVQGNLRERLTMMPYFWEFFSGVFVNHQAFLAWNDAAIKHDQGWLTARHVEFVIDARGVRNPKTLLAI